MDKKTKVLIIIAIILFVGLFFFLRPKSLGQTQKTAAIPESHEKTFEIVVKDKKIVSGLDTLTVDEGDTVTMKITVDEPVEVHLHGYDKMIELEKDVQGELSFKADLTGRFEFELEDSKTELGVLEVMPK